MWPQKWNASARWARSAAAITPLPLTASRSRPARARNPRRELVPATASLSTDGPGSVGEEALELVERVEGALREYVAVCRQNDCVGAARNGEGAPGLGVGLLVEELELDLRVRGDEPQRRLEGAAQRAARRGEDGDGDRGFALETLDEGETSAEFRPLVLQRESALRGDCDPQLAELPREREHEDCKTGNSDEHNDEARHEPGVGGWTRIRQERQRRQ